MLVLQLTMRYKKQLGNKLGFFEGSHAHDVKNHTDIENYFIANANLVAVSTHLGRPQLPLDQYFPIVFLRDPFSRAKSVFQFVKKDQSQPHSEDAQGSFRDIFVGLQRSLLAPWWLEIIRLYI